MSDLEKLVRDEIDNAEATRDDPISESLGHKRSTPAAVYSIRLSPEIRDQVERMAKDLDIPVSTLVRGFVLEGLAERRTLSVRGLIDRIGHDVQRLKDLV